MRLIVLLVLLVLLPGCSKQASKTGGEQKRDALNSRKGVSGKSRVFRWGSVFPRFIDPNRVIDTSGNDVAQNLFEGLLTHHVSKITPVPGVAKRYTVSADGRVYTFYLRASARWSNGRKVTARDFEYSWKRALTPGFVSQNAEKLYNVILGAKAYKTGKQKEWSRVGIKVIDDYTLQVTLKNPTIYFPNLVAFVAWAPVPREAVEKHGDKWTRPENIIVNGPYMIKSWKERDRIVFVKNPHYWDRASVKINRWEYVQVERATQAIKMYRLGLIDYLSDLIPLELIPRYKKQSRPDFNIVPSLCLYYFIFNLDKKPFDNPKVRQAFSLALNRDALVTNLMQGGQTPSTRFVSREFRKISGYKGPRGPGFNPARARKLLAEAGYPNGANMPPVRFVYNNSEAHKKVATYFQSSLKRHLGVRISIQNMEWKSLLAKLHKRDFQMSRLGWCPTYPDPTSYLMVFQSKSENNHSHYNSAEYDKLLEQILASADRKKRNAMIATAEKMLIRDQPHMPVYQYTRVYLLKPHIAGLESHLQDFHLVKYIYFK